jgi:hypothetical protein
MKRKWFIRALLLASYQIVQVQAADIGISGGAGFFSHYMWRGIQLSKETVIQPSFTLSYGGAAINLWGNYDLNDSELNEIDYTFSYGQSIEKWSLEAGFVHFDLKEGLDSDEIYLSAKYDSFVVPKLRAYYDIKEGTGAFLQGGIGLPFQPFENYCMSLDVALSYLADDGYVALDSKGKEFQGFFNAEISLSGSLVLNDHASIDPYAAYSFGMSDKSKQAIRTVSTKKSDDFIYGGVTLTIKL